jgi:hypothetical protein
MKKYIRPFRVETNGGRIVGHAGAIEQAEYIAGKGRGRWVLRWLYGKYIAVRQYTS